jgi:hypothetical protein
VKCARLPTKGIDLPSCVTEPPLCIALVFTQPKAHTEVAFGATSPSDALWAPLPTQPMGYMVSTSCSSTRDLTLTLFRNPSQVAQRHRPLLRLDWPGSNNQVSSLTPHPLIFQYRECLRSCVGSDTSTLANTAYQCRMPLHPGITEDKAREASSWQR